MFDRANRTLLTLRFKACLSAALALLALVSFAVPVAAASSIEGGNAFQELSQKAQSEEQTTSTATGEAGTSTTEAKNSRSTIFIGAGIALVLLVGIGYVIVRDARRVAPAGDVAEVEARVARDNAVQMRNRRAKAKAARQQRKKNLKKR